MNITLSLFLSFGKTSGGYNSLSRVRDLCSPGPSQGAAVAWVEAGSAPGSGGTGAAVT